MFPQFFFKLQLIFFYYECNKVMGLDVTVLNLVENRK